MTWYQAVQPSAADNEPLLGFVGSLNGSARRLSFLDLVMNLPGNWRADQWWLGARRTLRCAAWAGWCVWAEAIDAAKAMAARQQVVADACTAWEWNMT